MTMGRIKCTDCGKVWQDETAFSEDKGCDRGWCLNTEEAIMSRRRGRGVHVGTEKPPHIEAPTFVEPRKPTGIRSHTTSAQVESRWDKNEPIHELQVPDVININIFVNRS